MKYCSKCGKEINDDAVVCVYCGRQVEGARAEVQKPDAPNMGFAVLGFFFPLIGLILYLCWKNETPLKAKSAGKGALIGVIVSVACYLIFAIFLGSLMASLVAEVPLAMALC